MNENSTSTQAHLPLAERARQGLLLAEPELPVEELPLLEHPTDKEARRRFAYAVRAAMDYGDLAIVLKPVEMACYEQHEMQRVQVSRRIQVSRRVSYEQHEMQRVQVSWDAPVRERPAQGTRKLITWTETRRYFNREAYRAWRLTCPPELLSPLSQIGKWLGATPALSESIPPVETSLPKPPVSTARPASVANPEKRQRNDALNHAIRAALAVLSPSGGPLPRPPALFTYLAHNDTTKTVKGVAKGNRALLWVDDNNNEQSLTVSALRKRLDRIRQSD